MAMGFTLGDLRAGVSGSGRDVPPETDVMTVLESAMPRLPAQEQETVLRESFMPENDAGVAAIVAAP